MKLDLWATFSLLNHEKILFAQKIRILVVFLKIVFFLILYSNYIGDFQSFGWASKKLFK